jgi:hypothetical protein
MTAEAPPVMPAAPRDYGGMAEVRSRAQPEGCMWDTARGRPCGGVTA